MKQFDDWANELADKIHDKENKKETFVYNRGTSTFVRTPETPAKELSFHVDGKVLLRLNPDGSVWANPELKPDEIAEQVFGIMKNFGVSRVYELEQDNKKLNEELNYWLKKCRDKSLELQKVHKEFLDHRLATALENPCKELFDENPEWRKK